MSLGRIGTRAVVVGLAVLASLALMAGTASAATLTVCESGPPKCGFSNIPEAINAASSGDTVEVAAGTYNSTVSIEGKNLTLQGAGAERTIITGFVAVEPPQIVVTITGVTITLSDGVFNQGTLTLNHSVVTHTGDIAIFNEGTLTLNNSTVSKGHNRHFSGGGIDNYGGMVTLNNSTVSESTAPRGGGGIANEEGGTVTLHNSTISDNSAVSGGATSEESGGGIYNKSGTVTLQNTKITGNTAKEKGGGIYNKATVVGSNDTITGNTAPEGAGIFNEPPGEVNLKNSNVQSP
jgi:predicted outer membrane repeat protein